jgi:hypothetical protein
MIPTDPAFWSDYLRQTLECYEEPLLRQVAAHLFKPRSHWPREELIDRCVDTFRNAAVLDRRLQDLPEPGRRLLTCIGHSRQFRWKLGNLLELLAALGGGQGPELALTLFEAGLLYPDLLNRAGASEPPTARTQPRLKSFESWLTQGQGTAFATFIHPELAYRALAGDLGLPVLAADVHPGSAVHEADGLEWPLRLAALWQMVVPSPLRRTMQGDFFKRDLDRLREELILNAPPSDHLAEIPDLGLMAVALGQAQDVLQADQAELRAASLPTGWDVGLPETLASLWTVLPLLDTWNPQSGWTAGTQMGNPFPSAGLLSLLLLLQLPEDAWARPSDLEDWIFTHHPFWQNEDLWPSRGQSWIDAYLLGVVYQLRMLQAAKDAAGGWLVRLSPLGRWLLGRGELPNTAVPFTQTLLVQPNLEIVVYRQALLPSLISRLSRFATWKTLGAACTLHLQADAVYRGLESGLSFETILQTLEHHGMRATPPAVVESLRTWADKRERITVYPAATLFEFATPEDLNDALGRGLEGTRLSDRLLAVANESTVEFKHFRLSGTRDYGLPPEKCVTVEADGVTLEVDLARSDLLLDTEMQRFAEVLDAQAAGGRRRYRLTPASLAAARQGGLSERDLEEWFLQRSGQPLSAAARLLYGGAQVPPLQLRTVLVVHVATPELADGLLQWPGTSSLFEDRLGPTALVITADNLEALRQRLGMFGARVEGLEASVAPAP